MRDGAVVARRAHNPKVVGSSPAPATSPSGENKKPGRNAWFLYFNQFDFQGYWSVN